MIKYSIESIASYNGIKRGLNLIDINTNAKTKMSFDEIRDKIEIGAIQITGVSIQNNRIVIQNENKIDKVDITKNTTIFSTNEDIEKLYNPYKKYKRRELYKDIDNWIQSDTRGRILGLYGLRRTGKTVLLLQICQEYINKGYKVAYAELSYSTDRNEFFKELDIIAKSLEYKLIVIDEITYLNGFLQWSNKLADFYSKIGNNIIISGTQSLLIEMARLKTLYDRIDLVNTTYISFKEFSRLLNENDILTYIKYGGVLSTSRSIRQRTFDDYIQTAIVDNLENTFDTFNKSKVAWPELCSYYDKGKLTKIIQQFIMGCSETLVIKDIRREFIDRNLESALQLTQGIDLSEYDIKVLNDLTTYQLGIGSTLYNIDSKVIDEIITLLSKIDLIEFGNISNGKTTHDKSIILFKQPGLQYEQTIATIRSLVEATNTIGISNKDIEILRTKLIQDAEGRLLEQAIWVNLIMEHKKLSKEKQEEIEIFQLNLSGKEIDLVIKNKGKIALIEVKRSNIIEEKQSQWLRDDELNAYISNKFGEIANRYVFYTGENKEINIDNKKIHYINISDFLRTQSLGG